MAAEQQSGDVFAAFAATREAVATMIREMVGAAKAAATAGEGEDVDQEIKKANDTLSEKNRHGARSRPRSRKPL